MSRFVSKNAVLKVIASTRGGKDSRPVEKPVKEKKVNLKKLMKEQEKALAEAPINGEMVDSADATPIDNQVENVTTEVTSSVENNDIQANTTEENVSTDNVQEDNTDSQASTSTEEPSEEKKSSILSGIMSRINVVNKPDNENK